jgi:hypothetical protein
MKPWGLPRGVFIQKRDVMVYSSFLILFLFYFHVQAHALDNEALEWEERKSLTVFKLAPYISAVAAMNSDEPDDYDDEHGIDFSIPLFSKESMAECRDRRTAAEKEQEQRRIKKINEELIKDILTFMKKYPQFDEIIAATYTNNKKQNLGDIVKKIGDYFQQSREIDHADKFYDLSSKFYHSVYGSLEGNFDADLSKGYMHLDEYNKEVETNKPKKPTESMFYHLQQAVDGLSVPSPDEVADFASRDLIKIRDMIVRWYLYPKNIEDDIYFGSSKALACRVYAYGFVQKILTQAQCLKILTSAKRYDGSMTKTDLAKHLKALGFYGISQGMYQHNWVRADGFMIRVKRTVDYKAEFTIGITFMDPMKWKVDGTPKSLAQSFNGEKLIFNPDNEILKLAYDSNRRAVFVVPAFRKRDWQPFWFNKKQIDAMMKLAHFPLESFGTKNGKGYNTTNLENLLSFRNL